MASHATLWAAKELGLPAEAGADAARAAFLEHLQNEKFLPAESRVAAWNHWSDYVLPITRDGMSEYVASAEGEWEGFLRDFWELEPEVRETRWNDLSDHFRHGPIAARLNQISRVLAFPGITPHENPKVRELALIARRLFLMGTRARTLLRRDWLLGLGDNREWIAAMRELWTSDPRVIELDPALFEWIDPDFEPDPLQPLVMNPYPVYSGHLLQSPLSEFHFEPSHGEKKTRTSRDSEAEDVLPTIKVAVLGAFVLCFVCFVLFLLAKMGNDSEAKPPRYQSPPPAADWPSTPPPVDRWRYPPAENGVDDPWKTFMELEALRKRSEGTGYSGIPQPRPVVTRK